MTLVDLFVSHPVVYGTLRIVGLALLAGTTTAVVSFVYRARVRKTLPEGATVILGLGVVAIALNTRLIFVQFVGGAGDPLTTEEALINLAVFVVAGVASYGGRYVGNQAGSSDRFRWAKLRPDVSPIVRATGRFVTVKLPDTAGIEDIEGYDPVEDETKGALAGRTFDFPRGLTLDELQSQLSARLKEDHDIGYVDVELEADGTVTYLALGQRVAGLGPTLPPKSAAVAVRADPPFSATPGDTVQLWRTNDGRAEERLGTAELRASVGSVVTVVTDETIADGIDPAVDYRLMTLPADSHPEKEFAAMLRRSDETMGSLAIAADSPLLGLPVGSIDATVLAVSSGDGVETLPTRERRIRDGDTLFVLGRPDTLRKLESVTGVQLPADDDRLEGAAAEAVDWQADD